MASSSPKLSDKKYNNWVKAQLAVLFTKEGLEPFVCHEVQEFQLKCLDDICYNNGLFSGTLCSNCCTENVIKCPTNRICNVGRGRCSYHRNAATRYKPDGCPDKICHNFTTEIQNAHRYYGPSYKNTDATQWCSNSWEIAKCFMPPERYKDVACAQETDFNGIISVILYYKDFQLKVHENLSHRNNIFEQARDLSRNLRHSPTLEVEDTDLHQYFTVFQQLLSDAGYLATDIHAQNAKQKLLDLQKDMLVIEYVEVRKVLNDVAKEALDTLKVRKKDIERQSEIMREVLKKEDLHSLDPKTHERLQKIEIKTDESLKLIKAEDDKGVKDTEKARDMLVQVMHQKKGDIEENVTMQRINEKVEEILKERSKVNKEKRYTDDKQNRHNLYPSQPHGSQSVMIDDDEDDDLMGHDELDDEICFGHLRGNIVGIQYYSGTVNIKEMVALEREPENRYDINAIKVKNVGNVQVGHIKRELARPLAYIMDKGLARLEGVVPFGATNMYSMPVDISLWGKPENQKEAVDKLKKSGFYLTGGTQPVTSPGSGMSSSSLGASEFSLAAIEPRRTYLTPAEVKNELDKLFENIEEGDKTSLADPAQAIATPLYPHQKQALNWMVKRENNATLPPFWQEKNGKYFNTVLNFTSSIRPDSVRGESWDRCIDRKSEFDANMLLEKEIYPSKDELTWACHVFGRDSEIISHICSTISQHIKKQFKNVIDVFPSYKEDYESIIFLVIVKKKSTFSVFKDYEYCIRCENDVSTEGDLVAEYETRDETMGQFDNETFEKLRNCINDNANDLLERHSNINVILPSLVKSIGYETGQHNIKQVPCIALYVTVKGCIPLNETPFQNNINGFPIDVLEGKFEPFKNGPNEYHEHLKIGLAIHANVLNTDGVLGGTLGGFIDHSTHGLCGITCAHVVYSPAELIEIKDKKQCSLRKKVYQPIGKSSSAFGEVVQAVYDIGGSCTSGMEVALINIQKRQPKSGSFPETFTDFEAGFDARNPLCFNSGAVCETSEIKRRIEVYKFGMISGITRGSFALQGAVVRKSQMQGDCHGFRFNLMNQLLVLQIGEKPFAEHGDSGALVLTEGGQDSIAIGIVAGGMNSRRVFVTPICDILRAFGCTESKMHRFMPKCTQLLSGDYGEKMET